MKNRLALQLCLSRALLTAAAVVALAGPVMGIASVKAGGTPQNAPSTISTATLQVTLAVGDRTVRGRVLDRSGGVPGSEVVVSVSIPPSTRPLRSVSVGADGTFEIDRLRAADYELKAKMGSGPATQTARLLLAVGGAQGPSGIQIVIKGTTLQKGRVVIEGAARLKELLRFQPMIEVTDVLGVHRVPIRLDGTFEFQSFEGDYSVAIRDVPLGYEKFVTVTGNTVEVKLRVVQGDAPSFRLLPPR